MFNANTLDEATTHSLSTLPTLPSHLVKAHDAVYREETDMEYLLYSVIYRIIE
jgi:hypothetical protein